MILAAALLVLVGLGLFVAGLVTGATVLYWACVAVCVVAAALLVAARRQAPPAAASSPPADGPGAAATATAAEKAPDRKAPDRKTTDRKTPVEEPVAVASEPRPAEAPAGATAVDVSAAAAVDDEADDPPVEEVEVTDLLLVVDLEDEVLVVDEHPRYHVTGCSWVGSRPTIPLPLDEARTDGFTPCGVCRPDATLAERVRARR